MADVHWRSVAQEQDLKAGVPILVTADDEEILLVRLDDQIHACGHECTHYGAPLSEGLLCGHEVVCPWHHARFAVTTGRMTAAPALDDLPRYPVKVEDGQVYVGQAEEALSPRPSLGDGQTFLIVGAGAAGHAAAEALRREGFAGRVQLITAESAGPYERPDLSKSFLVEDTSAEEIALRDEAFYTEHGIELLTDRRVTALDPGNATLTLADGAQLKGDRVLLATGGTPRKLDIPGSDLEGCFLLRSLTDAEALRAAIQHADRVVVLGAGFIGLEVAASLTSLDLEIHVVAPEPVPMVRAFGELVGRRLQGMHEEHGVRFHLGHVAEEISGERQVEAVVLDDGTRIPTDALVIGLGITPALDFLHETGLVQDGAIPVDGRLRTQAERIFAAGDIARVPDPRTGGGHRVEHWVVAQRQGQHAARAMLGSEAIYDEVPFFWTRQYGESLKYLGFAERYDQVAYRGDVEGDDFLAGYYDDGTLRAVAGLGRSEEFMALGELIKMGRTPSLDQFQDEATDLIELLRRT